MIHPTQDSVVIEVHVIPRAGRTEVSGTRNGALLVRLAAAPVEGAANSHLIDFLAKTLGVPKRALTIASGERGRRKRVRVAGATERDVREKLGV